MDLSSGLPFFWIRNGLLFDYPALAGDARCDVLVVGGGISGALCAHACTTAGLDTVVIDGRPIGTGSTGASTALLQYEIDTPMHVLAERLGMDAAVRSYQLCAQGVEELLALADAWPAVRGLRRSSLQFASRRAHLKALEREHDLRARNGFQVERLTRAELEGRLGFSAPGAMVSQLAGEIDPYAFTHALLQDVLAHGGHVYDRSHMVHHEQVGSGFRIQVNGCTISADHLIMATGYESQSRLPSSLLDLRSTYAVASTRTDRAGSWWQDCLIWETAQPYLYLRTTPDHRVIIGGLDEPFRDPKRRDALLPRKTKGLVKAFNKLFPQIPFEPEYEWCGTFGGTKDGLPFIDRDPRTGAWYVLGMGGNGIVFSQVGARIVRDAILGRPNADAQLFRFDR